MAYYLNKPNRRSTGKMIQYGLAILALLIAITILAAWLLIRYNSGSDTGKETPQVTTPTTTPTIVTEPSQCLVIFNIHNAERFVLVQANPKSQRMSTVTIPSNLADADGCTLTEALHRHGAPTVAKTVSNALSLPISYYISLSAKGVEQFLGQLDSGVSFHVPEKIAYTDENGAKIQIQSGERLLSPGQVRTLLEYTVWKNASTAAALGADLISAVINQYLISDCPLDGYFSSLSNASITNLRIDNFNAFRGTLLMLAEQNNGTLCNTLSLPGSQNDGIFIPDVHAFRSQSGLY